MQHSSAHIDVLSSASRFQLTRGVRIIEDVMKLRFDEYRESFRDIGFYDAETRAYARTLKNRGSWKPTAECLTRISSYTCTASLVLMKTR